LDKQKIINELKFKATKSSGPGGQHVNKVASRVELYFDIVNSEGLGDEEKEVLITKLGNRISKDHILFLSSQDSRSQHKNKETVIKAFSNLLSSSFIKPKKRKPTKPTRSSILKKSQNKQNHSLKKELRKKPKID
jgi:ribosome-associated protein